jgi:sugar transferase EpsL
MSRLYRHFGKRLLDLLIAAPLLLCLLPVIACVAVLVRWRLGSPAIFRQDRGGRDGRVFRLMKFRTMTDERDERGEVLPDEQRLTRFGRLLRKLSLDELPQLWHVVRGDMSLIGPRPLLAAYLDRYNVEQSRRHEVRPGITGWAQVKGRNAISWDEKFRLDVWYVDNIGLLVDLRILFLSLWRVLRPYGIDSPEAPTMPEFMGNGCSDGNGN